MESRHNHPLNGTAYRRPLVEALDARRMNRIGIAVLFLSVMLTGCSTTSRWSETRTPRPWCAPGQRAVIYDRTYDAYMMSGPHTQIAFSTGGIWKTRRHKLSSQLDRYFSSSPIVDAWPRSGDHVGQRALVRSPYDLYLVSIDPIVIIGVKGDDLPVVPYSAHTSISARPLLGRVDVGTDLPLHSVSEIIVLPIEGNVASFVCTPDQLPKRVTLGQNDHLLMIKQRDKIVTQRE